MSHFRPEVNYNYLLARRACATDPLKLKIGDAELNPEPKRTWKL